MAKIKVDTTALEKKLGTMSDKINAIKESIDDIDKEMQKVEKYWKGDASKLIFIKLCKDRYFFRFHDGYPDGK